MYVKPDFAALVPTGGVWRASKGTFDRRVGWAGPQEKEIRHAPRR